MAGSSASAATDREAPLLIRGTWGEKRVPLIEDAAQAFGARVCGQAVGTFGKAGIYSFGWAKNVNSFYGGMMVTRDRSLRDRISAVLGLAAVRPLVLPHPLVETANVFRVQRQVST